MRRPYLAAIWGTVFLWALVIAPGCKPSQRPIEAREATTLPTNETIIRDDEASATTNQFSSQYDDALRRFERADFLKPNEESAPAEIVKMAPLFVREVGDGTPALWLAVPVDRVGKVVTYSEHAESMAVYYIQNSMRIRGRELERLSYVWILRSPPGVEPERLTWRGIRMIRGDNGIPIVSEIIGPNDDGRRFFVSQSIEDASLGIFGAPLKGRRFAVEASEDVAPDALVVRVISDGPQAMGPFVYVDSDGERVTTLLCRCMDSQFDDVRENTYYALKPLPTVIDSDHGAVAELHSSILDASIGGTDIDEVLRLPPLD